MRTQLASPAESGMTIILERLCIRPTEAIRQGDKPYMQHSPLLLRSVEQENKQTNKQTSKQTNSDSHSSLLETLRGKRAGKEYYRSLRMAIHINKEIRIPKVKTTLNRHPITINPLLS
jgi:hypothetical protein